MKALLDSAKASTAPAAISAACSWLYWLTYWLNVATNSSLLMLSLGVYKPVPSKTTGIWVMGVVLQLNSSRQTAT